MPVKRQYERIRTQGGGGVASIRNVGQAGVPGQVMARSFAKKASDYAKGLAVAAEEEATALAKAAVFSTGPNGLPQLPPDPTARMGEIARRTYSAQIEDRFAHQMTTAIRGQILEARNANLYDTDAFVADAQERINGMAADVPPGFEGAFQQIATGLLVDNAASIGHRQAQLIMDNAAKAQPVMNDMASQTVAELIFAGQDERAQMVLEDQLAAIDAQPDYVLDPAQKTAEKQTLIARAGATRLQRDFNLGEGGARPIQELIETLNTGEDAELIEEYFGGDGEAARRGAAQLNALLPNAFNREREAQARHEGQVTADRVAGGWASGSATDQQVLDGVLGRQLRLTDGAGGQRAVNAADWLSMPAEDRQKAMMQVKSSGFLPASMREAFNRLANVQDPSELAAGFSLYLDLKHAPSAGGATVDMTGELPENLQAIYGHIDLMHGMGEVGTESVVRAVELYRATQDNPWDERQFSLALNAEKGIGDGWKRVDEDTVEGEVRRQVNAHVFDGIDATTQEKAVAHRLFKSYMQMGHSRDEALELTRQGVENRYAESEFLPHGQRSAYAPEKHYAAPPSATFREMAERMGTKIDGVATRFSEYMLTGPVAAFFGPLVNIGADAKLATPFEHMVNAEIGQMIADNPELAEQFPMNNGRWDIADQFLVPGDDYILQPNKSGGIPPVYTVMMRDEAGRLYPLGTLDVREEWGAYLQNRTAFDAAMAADSSNRDRFMDFLQSGTEESQQLWAEVNRAIIAGEKVDWNGLMEGLRNE